MTLDVKKYLRQIPEADWKLGNSSKYAISGNYFFKRLTAKAPSKVHDFFMKEKSSNIATSYRLKFEEYHCLTDDECQSLNYNGENAKYNHVYVFEKVEFVKLEEQFKTGSIKEYITALDQLHYFFAEIDKAGITYHDVMWENIVWNKTFNELCVIDLDSMVESTAAYESLSTLGNPLFHVSFLKFREKYNATQYKLNDIKYLNLCIYHNMFFAFVLGLSQNDKRFNRMEDQNSVNIFVAKYIEGDYIDTLKNGQTIDKECIKVLKQATKIVSAHIEGKYNYGNPFEDMALLSSELTNTFIVPHKPRTTTAALKKTTIVKTTQKIINNSQTNSPPVPPKPVLHVVAYFTSNVTSGKAPLSVQFNNSSLNATGWKWDFGDGKNSTVQNPIHTYTAAGNYTVNLTASNANGTSSTLGKISVSTKTIGQIITLALQQISSKIHNPSSKKILIPGIILCLLLFMFMGQSLIPWNNKDSKNKENISQEIQSVPKETNSIIQKTDNTASYAKDEKTVEPEQSPVIRLPGNIWYIISDAPGVYSAYGRILREPNSYYQNGLTISGEVFYKPVMDENPDSQPQGEGYDMNIEIKNSGGLPFIFKEAQVNINDGKIEYFAFATTTKDTHKSNVIIENGGTQQFSIQSRAIELKMQPNYSEDNKLAMHFSLYHSDSGVSEPQNAVASFHAILPDYSTIKAGVWIPIEFTDFYSAQAAAYSKEESDLALIRTDKK